MKNFQSILLKSELILTDTIVKLSLKEPVSHKTKATFYKSLIFVILTYREKLLAECSGNFSEYENIETDHNGTISEGASSQRTSNSAGKAHENGPLRAANAITKNLIKSYSREMLPEGPIFEFRDLVVRSTDNFTYTFISYHAIMSEFKTPATQDPKIRSFFNVLLNIRLYKWPI